MRRKNAASAFVMLIVCCSFLAKAAASTHQLMTGRGALASAHALHDGSFSFPIAPTRDSVGAP